MDAKGWTTSQASNISTAVACKAPVKMENCWEPPNNLSHLTAARLRFGLNVKSLIWAAEGDQQRWVALSQGGQE
jgi:hypothetical protein